MSKKTVYFCDVCELEKKVMKKSIQCIFTTEQTEGRTIDPHLSNATMEICGDCYSHVVKGNYIWARGAMGHNTYYFKEETK